MEGLYEQIKSGKCEECPFVMHCYKRITMYTSYNEFLAGTVMDDRFDSAVSRNYEVLRDSGSIGPIENINGNEVVDDATLAGALRKAVGQVLARNDEEIAELKEDISYSTENCHGPLKMHAEKDGRVVTATACNSPAAPTGFSCEDVHIDRKPIRR